MILEAESAYYIPALSKHDLKPFLKIKNFLLGFVGCCFFQKLPPDAQLNHETYASRHGRDGRGRTGRGTDGGRTGDGRGRTYADGDTYMIHI